MSRFGLEDVPLPLTSFAGRFLGLDIYLGQGPDLCGLVWVQVGHGAAAVLSPVTKL